MECYTAIDIAKKYNLSKATVYRRFAREDFQQYISLNENGTKVIDENGLRILLTDVEPKESHETSQSETETLQETERELYERLIETKDKEIESLKQTVETLLRLNENNQILLLEKKEKSEDQPQPKKSLLAKIFGN